MSGANVECRWHRPHGAAYYLITLFVGPEFGRESGGLSEACYPQARAVVDDFGTLAIVRGWQ